MNLNINYLQVLPNCQRYLPIFPRQLTVEEFYRALSTLAEHCKYSDLDNQIRDRLVVGLKDQKTKEKLQLTYDLTLQKSLEIARQQEQIKAQMRDQNKASDIDEARKANKSRPRQPHQQDRATAAGRGRPRGRGERFQRDQTSGYKCDRWGKFHAEGRCPARGKICNGCKKKNHFEAVCRNRNAQEVGIEEEDAETDENEFFVDSVSNKVIEDTTDPWTTTLNVKGEKITFKILVSSELTLG